METNKAQVIPASVLKMAKDIKHAKDTGAAGFFYVGRHRSQFNAALRLAETLDADTDNEETKLITTGNCTTPDEWSK